LLSIFTISSLCLGISHASTIAERACAPYAGDCSFTACCSGLYCPYNNARCRPCHPAGEYCGDAVPCCSGSCTWSPSNPYCS
ncbi:hypothetical protein BDQ12DRAFT_740106, partial [Crucibulum laeve]